MTTDKTPDDPLARFAPGFLGLAASRIVDVLMTTGTPLARERGIDVPARSMSTVLLLEQSPLTVTELAEAIGITHAGAIKNTKVLIDMGLAERTDDPADARRKPLRLTEKGFATAGEIAAFMVEVQAVYSDLQDEIGIDVYDGLTRMESALRDRSLAQRFRDRYGR